MSVKVDDSRWREYKRKVLRDSSAAVVTPLPYAQRAADEAVRGFRATRIKSLEHEAIAADVLEQVKLRCPVDTGALRDSLTAEQGGDNA
jgi:hypothetical protein